MAHFGAVPLEELRDPFDRFILATAIQLKAPLVTADRAIAATGIAGELVTSGGPMVEREARALARSMGMTA